MSQTPSSAEARRLLDRLVDRVARRIRIDRALERGITGAVVYLLGLMVVLVLAKTGWVGATTATGWALGLLVVPVAAALWGWLRPVNRIALAQRLDRAHGLHDRLSTALALVEAGEDSSWARAQIADAMAHADAVEPKRAAPFERPTDLALFAALVVAVGLVAVLRPPSHVHPLPPAPQIQHDPVLDQATIAMERDRLEQMRDDLAELDDPEAEELLAEIDELLEQVENREISEKEFLERIEQIEDEFFNEKREEASKELADKLKEAAEKLEAEAKEDLEKHEELKEAVDALKKKDLDKAADSLEKLAEKLNSDKLSDKEREELADLLEKFAKHIDPDDPEIQKLIDKHEDLVRELAKKFENSGLESDKKRLERAKKELDKLKQDQKKKGQGQASRQLKQLRRKTEEMAEKLRKQNQQPQAGGQKPDQPKPDYQNEAGRAAKKAAEQMREQAKQKKSDDVKRMAKKQLEEMKETMRRSGGQSGQGGESEQDESQRAEDMRDFLKRARGDKSGQQQGGEQGEQQGKMAQGGQSGKPGEGQKGQGRKTKQPTGADAPGQGAGDRELGEETALDSKRKDTKVDGRDAGGKSKSQIIKAASEEGFATTEYKDVYVDYTSVAEEVMDREKVPAGYRYYIKRYFELIKPRD